MKKVYKTHDYEVLMRFCTVYELKVQFFFSIIRTCDLLIPGLINKFCTGGLKKIRRQEDRFLLLFLPVVSYAFL